MTRYKFYGDYILGLTVDDGMVAGQKEVFIDLNDLAEENSFDEETGRHRIDIAVDEEEVTDLFSRYGINEKNPFSDGE